MTDKLTKIFNTELSTGHLAQVVVSGSFTNAKTETNYIDTFLMVDDEFEVTYKKRMGASFDFHFIPDEVHKTQIGRPHLALQN